jgi:two-component system chemotaxis response regulator CheB
MFASAAKAYGASLAAVILTGMGSDGVEGLKAVRAAGGRVLAQDEASSVVYGMPGEAVAAGVVEAVLAVDAIAPRLAELLAGENHAHSRR